MGFIDAVTPKNTEEIKPNLFIQKYGKGYRCIEPLAWDGKIRWRSQLSTIISLRFIMTIIIILFLVWAYNHDNKELVDFYNMVQADPESYCDKIFRARAHNVGVLNRSYDEVKFDESWVTNNLSGNS